MNAHIAIVSLILIFFLLITSAFFSGSEAALLALSRIRLHRMVSRNVRNSKLVSRLVSDLDRLITTILVGNNVANVGISVIATILFARLFGNTLLTAIVLTVILTTIILVFGEIVPKIYSAKHPDRVSVAVARPMQFFLILLKPLVNIFTKISSFVIRIFGIEPTKRSPFITEEEIRLMIEIGKEEGVLGDEERKMLHRIFEFGDTLVSHVMIPLDKAVSINVNASTQELIDTIVEKGYSRIPVFKDSVENIVGVLYAKDILHEWQGKEAFAIKELLHPVYYVASDKKVLDLLKDFKIRRVQIAIVVDKNNKALGLVTLEDLIEEIIGDIPEENLDQIQVPT